MSQEILQRLRALCGAEGRIKPDTAWVHATRQTLLMQVRNTLPARGMTGVERMRAIATQLKRYHLSQSVRKPVLAISSSVLLALGGSLMSVSASEHALPGDFFYSLKLATEQARLVLVSDNEEKLKLKTKFTDRRVNELQQVAGLKQEPERMVQVAEILKRDLYTIKQQLSDVNRGASADKAVAAAKLVDHQTNAVISALQVTKTDLPLATQEKVTEVQSAAAETGIKAIEVLAQKHQESKGNVPAADVARAIQDHTKLVADVTRAPTTVTTSSPLNPQAQPSVSLEIAGRSASGTSDANSFSSLPEMVVKMKAITLQAFAWQKAKELFESGTGNTSTSQEIKLLPDASSSTLTTSTLLKK